MIPIMFLDLFVGIVAFLCVLAVLVFAARDRARRIYKRMDDE